MLLSHLPEDVLRTILQELLPAMDKGQSDICPNDSLKCLPVPRDLCNLMVVCTLFRRLAEPFVWRRAAIVLHDPNDPDADIENDLDCFQGPLVFQWPYLRDNPQLASHIRILTLEILGYKRDTFFSPQTLKTVVSHMSHLRVLRLYIYSKHRETEGIYMSLVDKPLLHTVITLYEVPPEVRMPLRAPLTHLNILEWNPTYESLLRAAPYLQSLAITGPDGEARVKFQVKALDTIPIPWGTLRKIALKWVKNWDLVLTNLSSWKNSHPNTPSPLSELTVQLIGPQMTAENVDQVSGIGQDLRALYLCGPSVVDKRALCKIIDAFPNLEDLGLLTDYWCKPWDVNLPTLLHSLERLPRLKRLHWNYIDQDVAQSAEAMFALRVRFQKIVPKVALRCKALDRITFNDESESSIENFFHSYSISRDRNGEYNGHVKESVVLTPISLDKTSWDFWDYEHV